MYSSMFLSKWRSRRTLSYIVEWNFLLKIENSSLLMRCHLINSIYMKKTSYSDFQIVSLMCDALLSEIVFLLSSILCSTFLLRIRHEFLMSMTQIAMTFNEKLSQNVFVSFIVDDYLLFVIAKTSQRILNFQNSLAKISLWIVVLQNFVWRFHKVAVLLIAICFMYCRAKMIDDIAVLL